MFKNCEIGQSAAKLLSSLEYGEGSTTIPGMGVDY